MNHALNIARVDLVSLRLVLTCVETGTLSTAAAVLHLSVSGASHRLRSLEDALGVQLFLRQRRGLEPTPAGQLVAKKGQSILALVRELNGLKDRTSQA